MQHNSSLIPFAALFRREVWRFFKVIAQTVITPMINSSLYLLIFGVSLGKNINMADGIPYLAFLIPGLVMMATLNNSFQNSSSSISIAKFSGELEDLRAAPLSASEIVWAMSLGGLVRGLMVGAITFLVGAIFFYIYEEQLFTIANPFTLLAFLIGGGLAFAKLGLAVAVWAKSFDQLSAVGSFVLLPLIYLGGVFFSLDGLHPVWQTISKFNPLLYFINGVRYGILGKSDVSVGVAGLVTLAALVFFHFLARKSVKKGEFGRW